jgi:hypothetical protein
VRKIENAIPPTRFAPAERAPIEVVKKQVELFDNDEILTLFLSKIPAIFIILNKYRQVVYMNDGALEFSGLEELSSILGKRPGEIFGCIHHAVEEGGCGTAEACTYCGAINSVLLSQKGKPAVQDCRLTCGPDEIAFDLRVWASPLEYKGEKYTAVTIQDISDEKRRGVIERIFFHDILNTISGLSGRIQLMEKFEEKIDQDENLQRIKHLTNILIEEVRFHQILLAAENKDLILTLRKINSIELLNELKETHGTRTIATDKMILINQNSENIDFSSDHSLLMRVIGNMITNALEATPSSGTIKIGCMKKDNNIEFWVQNIGFLTPDVQSQIFQRSYSTKAANRGLGTYSMKLLSSFLNGKVSFTSSKEDGTIFKVDFPLNMSK